MIRLAFFFCPVFGGGHGYTDKDHPGLAGCSGGTYQRAAVSKNTKFFGVDFLQDFRCSLQGITIGGIGGGDVKLMGACGLILGAKPALTGLFLALCLLVLWHAAGNMGRKKNRKKQKEEKEQAYPLVPFLLQEC